MRFNIKLDHAGIAEILKSSEMAAAVTDIAEHIAENARGIMVDGIPGAIPLPVEVVTRETPTRAAARVTLAHPSGMAVQAKHGVLTGGAAGAGVEVTGG